MVERLIAAGVPAELETISGAGHGFRGADAQRADDRAIAWFDKYLKPKPGCAHAADLRSRAERRDCGDRVALGQSAVEGAQRPRPRRAGAARTGMCSSPSIRKRRWWNSMATIKRSGAIRRAWSTPSPRSACQRQYADQRRPAGQGDRSDPRQARGLEIREPGPREHAVAQCAPHGARAPR